MLIGMFSANKLLEMINAAIAEDILDALIEAISIKLDKRTGALQDKNNWHTDITSGSIHITSTDRIPYAAIQNFGGKIPITEAVRGKMWHLYYSTGDAMYKAIALTNKDSITITATNYANELLKYDPNASIRVDKISNMF